MTMVHKEKEQWKPNWQHGVLGANEPVSGSERSETPGLPSLEEMGRVRISRLQGFWIFFLKKNVTNLDKFSIFFQSPWSQMSKISRFQGHLEHSSLTEPKGLQRRQRRFLVPWILGGKRWVILEPGVCGESSLWRRFWSKGVRKA